MKCLGLSQWFIGYVWYVLDIGLPTDHWFLLPPLFNKLLSFFVLIVIFFLLITRWLLCNHEIFSLKYNIFSRNYEIMRREFNSKHDTNRLSSSYATLLNWETFPTINTFIWAYQISNSLLSKDTESYRIYNNYKYMKRIT